MISFAQGLPWLLGRLSGNLRVLLQTLALHRVGPYFPAGQIRDRGVRADGSPRLLGASVDHPRHYPAHYQVIAKIAILWTIGIIVLLIGVILAVLGMVGHAVGGRRHYF
jgi:hypothetical protein